jgi:hypothetical protein
LVPPSIEEFDVSPTPIRATAKNTRGKGRFTAKESNKKVKAEFLRDFYTNTRRVVKLLTTSDNF